MLLCMIQLNNGDKAINDKENIQISKLSRKFLLKIEKDNPLSIYERMVRRISFDIGIKPHVFKNKIRYEGIIGRWMENGYYNKR